MHAKRAPRQDELAMNERIAMNLFWRKGIRVGVLAKVFNCARNTIYYSCLTGGGAYPSAGTADKINKYIDRVGMQKAWDENVSDEMIRAVNAANKALVNRNALPRAVRPYVNMRGA
jgi:hypothetical protein